MTSACSSDAAFAVCHPATWHVKVSEHGQAIPFYFTAPHIGFHKNGTMHLNQDKPNSKKTQKKNQDLKIPFGSLLGFGVLGREWKGEWKGSIERTWKDERWREVKELPKCWNSRWNQGSQGSQLTQLEAVLRAMPLWDLTRDRLTRVATCFSSFEIWYTYLKTYIYTV